MTLEERLRAVAGVWVGTYTHRAPDGAVLERFASGQETRLEGDRWYERIVYRWPDGRRRTLDFRARFDASGQQMVLDDPGFHGEAFLVGDDVLVFPYRWKNEPGRQVVETVVVSGPDRKTRVWQTYEAAALVRVTVIVEQRVAEAPAVWR